jgi:hypothetical protein
MYVIMDNLSANETPAIRTWAAKNNVELCFPPTSASWANPIEAQFGPLRNFVMGASNHPNHTMLARKLQTYLRWRNANARHPDVGPNNAANEPASAANANNAGADPTRKPPESDPANVHCQQLPAKSTPSALSVDRADREEGSGDVLGRVAAQEDGQRENVLGLTDAATGICRRHLVDVLLAYGGTHPRRIGQARSQDGGAHALVGQFPMDDVAQDVHTRCSPHTRPGPDSPERRSCWRCRRSGRRPRGS